jgi:hypothetical protein
MNNYRQLGIIFTYNKYFIFNSLTHVAMTTKRLRGLKINKVNTFSLNRK